MIIDKFEEWLRFNEPQLKDKNIRIEITRPEVSSNKESAYVDIDTDSLIARVTLWDTGECDMEIIDPETDETTLYRHVIFQSTEGMSSGLKTFFEQL